MNFLEKLKDSVNKFIDDLALSRLQALVSMVVEEREKLKTLTDDELKKTALKFKEEVKNGKSFDDLLVPAFSLANEVARRIQGRVPYNVQILAGIIIHQGKVVEMKAGEGKTLTETMPVFLDALSGRGVHLITTNDYLAERDCKLNSPLFNFLGMTVGFITSSMKNDERRKAYACDITYVSNQEIGFDFLRDNLVMSRSEKVLRNEHPLSFGIVDEIDSILIDESRTPLIIAEPLKDERNFYDKFTKIAGNLLEGEDYIVDYVNKSLKITDSGLDNLEKTLGGSLFSQENPMYVFYLDVCLKAKALFEKSRDYIVTDDAVEIVDEFTGRVLEGRRFSDGVHQAIEAKEGIKIKDPDHTVASITFQNFFPMYEKLSGMSGTVMHSREEFGKVYKKDVVQVPTNKPMARIEHNDLFFKTRNGKLKALVKKALEVHSKNQPILIGARTVETAKIIAYLLESTNMPFQLLTAADAQGEAEKIANAGQPGMVTVATNMAGRGTDIMLGTGVPELGGLFVLGSERHESRRIDDQLVGRSGRQGQPGESQFMISMEDEIMQLFGSEKIIDLMDKYDLSETEGISGDNLDEAFKQAQDFVESKNLDGRLYLYKYDSVVSLQQKIIYDLRNSLLENEPNFVNFLNQTTSEFILETLAIEDVAIVSKEISAVFKVELNSDEIKKLVQSKNNLKQKDKLDKFIRHLKTQILSLKNDPNIYQASQTLILQLLDNGWSKHLELMDILKEEAGLFSYATEDPLIDFILESEKLFGEMQKDIKKQFLSSVFLFINQHKIEN